MLKEELFTIIKASSLDFDPSAGKEMEYRLLLNSENVIFKAHFSGYPILPGACIAQIIKELAECMFEKKFFLHSIRNMKFLNIINPLEHSEVTVEMVAKSSDDGLNVSALIRDGDTIFSKANLTFFEDES
ncbi:MAG: hypothetical protein LBR84_11895 [Tannerella sp.]|jgi:3-hydroxyacyl-[acyl-carrier-protein] dehydratase|nr:hypothetical protein [Tannerella sp.]